MIKNTLTVLLLLFLVTYCTDTGSQGTKIQKWGSFDAETLVRQKTRGFVYLKSLNVGDEILTYKNDKKAWSKIQGWIYRDETAQYTFRKIGLKSGEWVGIAPKQNIAFADEQHGRKYYWIQDIQIKTSNLYVSNTPIIYNVEYKSVGMYAPMTSQHSYLVFTPKTHTPILTHDWAGVKDPEKYQLAADVVFGIGNILSLGSNIEQNDQNSNAKWTMDLLASIFF